MIRYLSGFRSRSRSCANRWSDLKVVTNHDPSQRMRDITVMNSDDILHTVDKELDTVPVLTL